MAKLLLPDRTSPLHIFYHTPVGDVRSRVSWASAPADRAHEESGLLLVLVREGDGDAFTPKPGAAVDISFAKGGSRCPVNPPFPVLCLAPPMRLYRDVGVALLCFLPQNTGTMEKTGKLHDGAPSAVSGLPSTGVSDDGEPVADGEKAASLHQPPPEDFDVPRDSGD